MADDDWRGLVKRVWIIPSGNEGAGVEDVRGNTVLSFDTVVREGHTANLEVTDNPVETGVVVSDHAYMKPQELEIEGAVGDVWLYALDSNGQKNADPFESEVSRAATAFQLLLGLQRSADPFSVQTGLRLYQNMVITSLAAEQDADTAAILYFKATLREVIQVSTRKINVPPRKPGKPHRAASPKVAGGEAKGRPASTTECDTNVMSCTNNKSVAKGGWDSIAAKFKQLTGTVLDVGVPPGAGPQ